MPWEKKKKAKVEIPILKTGINKNNTQFTFESFQRLIKGLGKSKNYHTIVFNTIPQEFRDKV